MSIFPVHTTRAERLRRLELERGTLSPQLLDYRLSSREYAGSRNRQQSVPYRECLRVHTALYHLDAGGERLFIQLGVQEL